MFKKLVYLTEIFLCLIRNWHGLLQGRAIEPCLDAHSYLPILLISFQVLYNISPSGRNRTKFTACQKNPNTVEEIWIRFSQFGSLWCSLILPKWDKCKLCIDCGWPWNWGDVEFLEVFLSWNPWFVLCPWDRISLFSFCWPGICCMSQTVLKSVVRCTQPT